MSLAEGLRQLPRRNTECRIRTLLRNVDEPTGQAFTATLEDRAVSSHAISRLLVAHGHDISPDNIARHRREECSCSKIS